MDERQMWLYHLIVMLLNRFCRMQTYKNEVAPAIRRRRETFKQAADTTIAQLLIQYKGISPCARSDIGHWITKNCDLNAVPALKVKCWSLVDQEQ